MRLPEIRERLYELSVEIKLLSEQITRRSHERGPRTSVRMTPVLARQIRAYAKAHPALSQMRIAEQFKVNSGRVSEVLNGTRK